jgi:hypothetical protein
LYSKYLTEEAVEGYGEFKIGGHAIHTVRYADDLMQLVKNEMMLLGVIDRLLEMGRCCGMEMNVEKIMVMRISKQPAPIHIMTDHKQLENNL